MRQILGVYSAPRPHWVGDGFPVRTLLSHHDQGAHITGLEKRDALIALDAHCNGASHRDVAMMIFGSDKVEAEWAGDGCDLKDYVRRCRSRGARFMLGGYRRLLRGPRGV